MDAELTRPFPGTEDVSDKGGKKQNMLLQATTGDSIGSLSSMHVRGDVRIGANPMRQSRVDMYQGSWSSRTVIEGTKLRLPNALHCLVLHQPQ
jgi:hypothetical protein